MSLRSAKLVLALAGTSLISSAEAQQLQQIGVEGIQANSHFGGSMGLDGNDLIVGSRWDNQRANNAGAAYVFTRPDGDLWEQVAKITANDADNSDFFGADVDIDGDWAVVGAPGFDRMRGAAYFFQRSGDNWVQRKKVVPGGRSDRSVFGTSVSIDGDYAVIGAPDHFRSGETRTGAVFVYFRHPSNGWTQQAFIMPSDAGSVDYIGASVALSGNFLAIGTPGDNSLRGAVYVYRRDGSNWTRLYKLIPGDSQVGDGFGMAVSMDPNWLAVGAPHDDQSVSNQGRVTLYRRNGNSFVLDSRVTAADPRVSQMFGFSLEILGAELLIGAPGDRRGAGAAYSFERDGNGTWRQNVKLMPEAVNNRAAFGRTVGIGQQDVLVGAAGETGAQPRSGGVYSLGGGGILRQGFRNIEANLAALRDPALDFGDIDNDGDLDVAAYGRSSGIDRILLYKNNGDETFELIGNELEGPAAGVITWADINNDGYVDLVAAGDFEGGPRTDVYLNDGTGSLSKVDMGIPGYSNPSLGWADYDRDGDFDLLLAGTDPGGVAALALLQNGDDGSFTAVETNLQPMDDAMVAWGDYDNDGDPDVAISGIENGQPAAVVYRNLPNGFQRRDYNLPGINGQITWVDVTSDGFYDLFLCGESASGVRTALLRNDEAQGFVEFDSKLPALESCRGSWGDYDNDGDDDLALIGLEFGNRVTDIYENLGEEGFDHSRFKLNRIGQGSVSLVDFNRDGRLDLAVAGQSEDGLVVELYRNNVGFERNQPPVVPKGLRAEFDGNDAVFRWKVSTDDKTPDAALTYNIRVGSTPGGIDIVAPNTTRDGFRTVSQGGNVGHVTTFRLSGLDAGIYYWSVQAIDDAYEGSKFAPEGSFVVGQENSDFHDVNAGLSGVMDGSAHWVDFRRSGYLDMLLTGRDDHGPFTGLYRYQPKGDFFIQSEISFPGVAASDAAFGDYDNDLDMDMVLIGESEEGTIARVYRNEKGASVTDISAPLTPVIHGAVAMGDLDNDGDPEIVLTGQAEGSKVATVYRNDRHDTFLPSSVLLTRLSHGSIAIGDYDGDRDNDILLTGFDGSRPRTILYRNNGFPSFTPMQFGFIGISNGQGSLADYDGDGDLDVLLSGHSLDGPLTQLYENRGIQSFVPVETSLPNLEYSSISWGDYDVNGRTDVLLSGYDGSKNVTAVYRYTGPRDGFQLMHIADLPATKDGRAVVGDYDRDGRLDILVAGEGGFFATARVIRNKVEPWTNTPPSKPTGLNYTIEGNKLHLYWESSQDAETPSAALSYDLRVSTTYGGSDIMAPNTRLSGNRFTTLPGNVGHNTRWTIVDPPLGRITVTVHAVDGGFLASAAAERLTLEIGEDQSSFVSAGTALPGVAYGQASWVDLDGDGDVDISVVGGAASEAVSAQFLNNGNAVFDSTFTTIPGVSHSTSAWADFDGDGDKDLFVSGQTDTANVAQILRNDGNLVFVDIEAPIQPVTDAAASWVDFDSDGDFDLVVSGEEIAGLLTELYRNDGEQGFTRIPTNLPGTFRASHDWADYDGNGLPDLLMTGSDGTFPVTRIFKNLGEGNFEDAEIGLTDVFDGTGDWVDVDTDGDLDVVVTGHAFSGVVSEIMLNEGNGVFVRSTATLPGVRVSATSWGDYDNDGDLDLAISGWDGISRLSKVYANNGAGTFAEVFTNIPGTSVGSLEWADADGDGDLDLLVSGATDEFPIASLYLYDSSQGSGKGTSGHTVTSAEEGYGSSEFPLPENGFLFKQSYPNPFSARSTVHFAVGKLQNVKVSLYNVVGQRVAIPYDRMMPANEMATIYLDGSTLASGAYFLRIEGERFTDTQTVIVNK